MAAHASRTDNGACCRKSRSERDGQIQRTEIVAACLAVEFAAAKDLSVGQLDAVINHARAQDQIAHRNFFVDAVAALEGIAVEKYVACDEAPTDGGSWQAATT